MFDFDVIRKTSDTKLYTKCPLSNDSSSSCRKTRCACSKNASSVLRYLHFVVCTNDDYVLADFFASRKRESIQFLLVYVNIHPSGFSNVGGWYSIDVAREE
jgi:hypothetical protein